MSKQDWYFLYLTYFIKHGYTTKQKLVDSYFSVIDKDLELALFKAVRTQ